MFEGISTNLRPRKQPQPLQRTVQHATTPRTRRLLRFAPLGAAAPANDEQQTAQHATNPNTRRQIRFAPLGAAAPANANSHRPPTKPPGAAEQDNTICAYVICRTSVQHSMQQNHTFEQFGSRSTLLMAFLFKYFAHKGNRAV